MSALLRARLSSFLAGVALGGAFGVYQLRGDMARGQDKLLQQVGGLPGAPSLALFPLSAGAVYAAQARHWGFRPCIAQLGCSPHVLTCCCCVAGLITRSCHLPSSPSPSVLCPPVPTCMQTARLDIG